MVAVRESGTEIAVVVGENVERYFEPGRYVDYERFVASYGDGRDWKKLGVGGDVFDAFLVGNELAVRGVAVKMANREGLDEQVLASCVASSRLKSGGGEDEMAEITRAPSGRLMVAEKRRLGQSATTAIKSIDRVDGPKISDLNEKKEHEVLRLVEAMFEEVQRAHAGGVAIFDMKVDGFMASYLNPPLDPDRRILNAGSFVDFSTVFLMPPVEQLENMARVVNRAEDFVGEFADMSRRVNLKHLENDFSKMQKAIDSFLNLGGREGRRNIEIEGQFTRRDVEDFLTRYPSYREVVSESLKGEEGVSDRSPERAGLVDGVIMLLCGVNPGTEFEQECVKFAGYLEKVANVLQGKVGRDLESLQAIKWLRGGGVEQNMKMMAQGLGFTDETMQQLGGFEKVFASYLIPGVLRKYGLDPQMMLKQLGGQLETTARLAESSMQLVAKKDFPNLGKKWWIAVQTAECDDWELLLEGLQDGVLRNKSYMNGFHTETVPQLEHLMEQRRRLLVSKENSREFQLVDWEKELEEIDRQIVSMVRDRRENVRSKIGE